MKKAIMTEEDISDIRYAISATYQDYRAEELLTKLDMVLQLAGENKA